MEPMRTLIVDDEAPARERLKRLLADMAGVEIIGEAEDGVQAVELIERQHPDLVLLDIQMPGLDGFGVIEALEQSRHGTGHCACCKEKRHYTLIGFRSQPRKTLLPGGQQAEFPIRMMRCSACGAKFSLLPSFLAREKHFALDIIGHAVNKLVLFGQSLQATLADLTILVPGGHSKQTLLDWLTWFGTLAPATILTRAGIQGTGYFQEDEVDMLKTVWSRVRRPFGRKAS